MGTDCCWIQLVKLGNSKLPLVSSRGFTPGMQREMASIDMEHRFCHEIVGLGHRIIIPNLSRDGNYNMPLFEKAGFHSLLAMPIMTYRVHGILGMAYHARKKFSQDYTELIAVIANLVGMSLNKAMLSKQQKETPKPPDVSYPAQLESSLEKHETQSLAAESGGMPYTREGNQNEIEMPSKDFQDHVRRMRTFIRTHKVQQPEGGSDLKQATG